MTELAEGVAIVIDAMDADRKCEHRDEKSSWKVNLVGDGGRLEKNLKKYGVPKPLTPPSVKLVRARAWPSQAHHLIPHQQLIKHPVTAWLTTSPQSGATRLTDDNHYDVDHGANGKFMPYASSLMEWAGASTAEKEAIVGTVMGAAGIQLHQGPHSFSSYGVGESGYKTRVAEYLERIHDHGLAHAATCEDCKSKGDADKVPPRQNVVRFLDLASTRLEVDINCGRIFVSRRAAGFAAAGGVMG